MKDQFDDHLDKNISSLVDGELGEAEHEQTVTSMLADDDKCSCWERYHLISNAMKRNLPHVIDCQFASRVKSAIENEPTVLAPSPQKSPSFGKRMAGLAVAASVATMAVLGVQFIYKEDGTVSTQQMAKLPESEMKAAKAPANQAYLRHDVQTVTQSYQQSPIFNQPGRQMLPQIHKYLLDHARNASGGMSQGGVTFSRTITNPETEKLSLQKKSESQEQSQR